jgi:hypothetical protein
MNPVPPYLSMVNLKYLASLKSKFYLQLKFYFLAYNLKHYLIWVASGSSFELQVDLPPVISPLKTISPKKGITVWK